MLVHVDIMKNRNNFIIASVSFFLLQLLSLIQKYIKVFESKKHKTKVQIQVFSELFGKKLPTQQSLNILKTHPFFIEHYHLTLDLSHLTNNSCEKTIAKQFFSQEAAHPRGLRCLKKHPLTLLLKLIFSLLLNVICSMFEFFFANKKYTSG